MRLTTGHWLFLFGFISCLFWVNKNLSWSSASRSALPLTIVLEGNLEVSEYQEFSGDWATLDQQVYCDKPPLQGILMVPIIEAISIFTDLDSMSPESQLQLVAILGTILFSCLPFALLMFFCYRWQLKETRHGLLLVVFAFMGSYLFVLSADFWNHLFSALLIVLSYRSLEKRQFYMFGLYLGAAVCNEYSLVLIGFAFGLWLLLQKEWKGIMHGVLGLLPFALFLAFYNWQLTGNALDLPYRYQENFIQNSEDYGFTAPSLEAIWHTLISPYRGLLFYAPLLLGLAFLKPWKKQISFTLMEKFVLITSLCFYFIMISNKSWVGGWVYGPRYLAVIPALLFFVFLRHIRIENTVSRLVFYGLGVLGLVVSFFGKFFPISAPTGVKFPLMNEGWPALLEGRFNNNHLVGYLGIEGAAGAVCFLILFGAGLFFLNKRHSKSLV